jgi:hypothetical protein
VLDTTRTWGDGVGKTRAHEIEVVSYEMGVTVCAIDGTVLRFGAEGPEQVWDAHRGVATVGEQRAVERAAMATDAEVNEFLRWVSQERGSDTLPPTVSRQATTQADNATGEIDTGLEFIEMIRERQALCTCATTDVFDCPNYMPGDEETDDSE